MAHRTTLLLGSVEADVSLSKASGPPSEAQYEVRRPGAAEAPPRAAATPFEDVPLATEPEPATPAPAPAPRHGLTVEGEWVDLTERLAEIDDATRLQGLEVVAAIDRSSLPNLRVRDSYYVCADGRRELGVLAHLWSGLRDTRQAALVRWTKRKNQALGALVAQAHPPHLCLLELEWSQNMRPVPAAASLGRALEDVSERGRASVGDLVAAYSRTPAVLAELRDERAGQRADLLEAARRGDVRRAEPAAPEPEPEAAAALRESLASL